MYQPISEISQFNLLLAPNRVEPFNLSVFETFPKESVYDIWECFKDLPQHTALHSLGVAYYSIQLGEQLVTDKEQNLGFEPNQNTDSIRVEKLGLCALLHDTGKTHISVAPFLTESVSDPQRLKNIQIRHVEMGPLLLDRYGFDHEVQTVARQHHMNFSGNGSSYPQMEVDESIHLYSQIVKVADLLEAMTSPYRQYKKPMTLEEAKTDILKKFEKEELDPRLKEAFEAVCRKVESNFPLPVDTLLYKVNTVLGLDLTI